MSSLIGKLASKIEIWFGNGKKNEMKHTHSQTVKSISSSYPGTLTQWRNDEPLNENKNEKGGRKNWRKIFKFVIFLLFE